MATATEVAKGLLILAKYDDDVSAEHDAIYAGPTEEIVESGKAGEGGRLGSVVSKEDAAKLLALGWHIDTEADRWARFV